MTGTESVPTTWDVCDEQFFRIVANLLHPTLVAGGTALLAAND
jgi:hypothetical protein